MYGGCGFKRVQDGRVVLSVTKVGTVSVVEFLQLNE
jgi:hypothetical protein